MNTINFKLTALFSLSTFIAVSFADNWKASANGAALSGTIAPSRDTTNLAVGITTTTNYKLYVGGTSRALAQNILHVQTATNGTGNIAEFYNASTPKVVIKSSGNVGIGVDNPSYSLSVKNDASQNQAIFGQGKTSGDVQICVGRADDGSGHHSLNLGYANDGSYGYMQLTGYPIGNGLVFGNNGNVGVGVGALVPSEKLEVAGNIKCQKVLINNWTIEAPDYVFDKEYKLRSLKEVEKHISAKKHLPDVPSASDMKKNGVDLSELNMTLLKKVEELTLYVIEQNKKIEVLERKVSGE